MSGERQAAVRAAEKLLRVGKLPPAIEAYTRLVDEQPGDLDTALLLAQLHLRARDVDGAVGRFASIADAWRLEGKLEPAFDTYKKILAIRPADEHALGHAAALAITQGQTWKGASTFWRWLTSRLRATTWPAAGDTLAEAATLDPSDTALRERVFQMAVASGNFARAREHALTTSHRRRVADALHAAGLRDEAIELLREALQHDPRSSARRSPGSCGCSSKPETPLPRPNTCRRNGWLRPRGAVALVEVLLRGGRTDEAIEIARAHARRHPETVDAIARLAASAAPHTVDAAVDARRHGGLAWTETLAVGAGGDRAAAVRHARARMHRRARQARRSRGRRRPRRTASHAQEMLADAYLASGNNRRRAGDCRRPRGARAEQPRARRARPAGAGNARGTRAARPARQPNPTRSFPSALRPRASW